ncbi:MAG: transglutaminase family protein [Proteobacteria bacterium]|nr:transglutaminase family protein [Pseudomonadota bacterium]
MRISIRHRTVYGYSEPAHHSVQYLRVTPRDSAWQEVRDWRLAAPGALAPWTDHFGNRCHTLTVTGPVEEIVIEAVGTVETAEAGGVLPFEASDLPLGVYARTTGLTRADDGLRAFAERHRAALDDDRVAGLHALMRGVAGALRYDEDASHAHATAAEALAEGAGDYPDHAHVFIAACRHLGLAARYVGGYLASGGGAHRVRGHGWAEAAVPDLGWVGFDPANGRAATEDYLRIAVGFDSADAAAVRGIRRDGGEESTTVEIEIEELATQQQ